MAQKTHLYESIAQNLEESILSNILKTGDKLPSVRILSKQKRVSPSTIFQAYYQLEAKGLIEARPKSGYYVRYQPQKNSSLPKAIKKVQVPYVKAIETHKMIAELESLRDSQHVLKLSAAIPALKLLPINKLNKSILEATRQEKEQLLTYAPPQGNHSLREQIAVQLLNFDQAFGPEDILITNGCIEGINLALQSLTKRGDLIVMDELIYFGIHQAVENLGLQVVPIPIDPIEGLDMETLKEALKKYPVKVALFVSNFNNPTGSLLSDEKKEAIVQLLDIYEVPLIEDDVYGELYFGKRKPSTFKQFDKNDRIIYCNSFSKTLVPGYRIGFCIPGRYKEKLVHSKWVQSIASSNLSQSALAIFLKKGRYAYHLKKLRKALHLQSLKYSQKILEYFPEEIRFNQPKGGLVMWIEFPEGFNGYELFVLAKKEHIGLAPGQIFSLNESYKNFIRISFSMPFNQQIDQALKRVGELSKKILSLKRSSTS